MVGCASVCGCVCFPTDLRIQVLNHNNKPEKLTLSEKIEVILFEARISVFLIGEKKMAHEAMAV